MFSTLLTDPTSGGFFYACFTVFIYYTSNWQLSESSCDHRCNTHYLVLACCYIIVDVVAIITDMEHNSDSDSYDGKV
jgi:hypothetical protein